MGATAPIFLIDFVILNHKGIHMKIMIGASAKAGIVKGSRVAVRQGSDYRIEIANFAGRKSIGYLRMSPVQR